MKNFRKVLALVLVVATLFSFTAMTSAKTYTDADKISYNEAVTVLSAVGILNGYEDDSFKPTQTISREEMAKMIAVLANAGTDVSTLYASACTFADVPTVRWSASYVAYCAKTGIVAGRSTTTFDPTAKVTGLETAKMLLVVLGFDAEEQGYVGADWKVNVLRDAKVMGLLNNFASGYDIEAAITREEAAQMMLNALEAPCVVGLLSKNTVTVTNAIVFGGQKVDVDNSWNRVSSFATLLDAMKAGKWALYGNVVISDDILAEVLFGLTKDTTTGRDCYGRPATVWTYKTLAGVKKQIGVNYAGDPVFESTNTTKAKMAAALKAYDGVEAVLYVDGIKKDTAGTETLAQVLTMVESYLGKGVQVEVYYNDNIVTVVVINTYIAVIDQVNTAKHTVDFDVLAGTNVSEWNFVNEYGLTTADEGKVVLLWFCNDYATTTSNPSALHDLKIIEPTVATVTSATTVAGNKTKSTFTADGKTYEYAFNTDWSNFSDLIGNQGLFIGSKVDIYTDLNGYVMHIEEHDDTEYGYAVIDDKSVDKILVKETQGVPTYKYVANLINFEDNAAPGEDIAVNGNFYDFDYPNAYDTLVKYTYDANGLPVVVDAVSGFNSVVSGFNGTGVQLSNGTLSKYASKTVLGSATITEKTQILLRVYDYTTGTNVYKYFDGKNEIDATYKLSHAQYFSSNGYVTYLYAEAEYATAAKAALVLGYADSTIYLTEGGEKVGYNTYEALVNGEEALIAYENVLTGGMVGVYTADLVCLGKITMSNEPVYVVSSGEMTEATADGDFTVNGNTIMWNGITKDLASDCKIIVAFPEDWDSDNDGINDLTYTTVSSNTALNNYIKAHGWNNGKAWAYDNDGDGYIDLLYVQASVGTDVNE